MDSILRILGVDPGTRLIGYGCVEQVGAKIHHITHGTLKVCEGGGKAPVPLEDRLLLIYEGLSKVIAEFKPTIMAVEKVFFAKNVSSALKLGQARGVVILSGKTNSMEIVEYSATEIKLAVAGHGHADKDQVAKMVQLIVGKLSFPTSDASDGLALAICHAYCLQTQNRLKARHPDTALQIFSGKSGKKKVSMAEAVGMGLLPKKV